MVKTKISKKEKELIDEARVKIFALSEQQDAIYKNLIDQLGDDDMRGFIFDAVYNDLTLNYFEVEDENTE